MAATKTSKSSHAKKAKVYPAKDKIQFLIADDIRQETRGKLTLLGLFAGGDIIVSKDAVAAAKAENKKLGIPVGIVFVVTDGKGEFNLNVELISPTGNRMWAEDRTSKIEKRADATYTLAIKVVALEVIEGQYTARLRLDDEIYDCHFKMRVGTLPD